MPIASQQDASLVAAMAREALDDAALIDGAVLTEREARALWTLEALGCGRMTDQLPPLNGIARKTRADKGVARKSSMDTFCDLFRRMSPSEQATALEVLRQIQRLGAPQLPTDTTT